jgi:hypothetical protein
MTGFPAESFFHIGNFLPDGHQLNKDAGKNDQD